MLFYFITLNNVVFDAELALYHYNKGHLMSCDGHQMSTMPINCPYFIFI